MIILNKIVNINPKVLRAGLEGCRKHFSQDTAKNHYDIIVVGGGMCGTTLACTLAKNQKLSNKRLLLLEGAPNREWQPSAKYSNRVSALNAGSYNLLSDIGAWGHIEKIRFCPVRGLQVSDSASDAVTVFDKEQDPVVRVVENDLLVAAVQKELKTVSNAEVLYQSKIKNCVYNEGKSRVDLELENGTAYSCDLLLGCDGANSQVRKSMGIHHVSWNYNQMGLVATLKIQEGIENNIAWQRFLPSCEVVALLPLTNELSSLVWTVSNERAKELMSLPIVAFVDALNEAMVKDFPKDDLVDQAVKALDNLVRLVNLPSTSSKQISPKIVDCEEESRASFPLGFGHATNYISKGVALVGDAAHRIHPMAGQGVNLGFGDVVYLNRILGEAVYSGKKLDSISILKEYETQRQRHNLPTMLAVDGLYRIYSSQFAPFVLMRTLGMQVTHALKPVKDLFMVQAAA